MMNSACLADIRNGLSSSLLRPVFLERRNQPAGVDDDVDASQALIARNMLTSGDWSACGWTAFSSFKSSA